MSSLMLNPIQHQQNIKRFYIEFTFTFTFTIDPDVKYTKISGISAIPSFRARPSKSTRRDVSNCEDKQEEARLKTVRGFTHIRGHYPHFPVSTPKDTLSALYSPKDTLSTLCSQNDGHLQGIAGTGARLRCHCQCRVIMSDV